MDGLSVAASIIAVIQLTGKLVGYLNDVKDAPKERADCAREASSFYSLLVTLKYDLDESNPDDPWFRAVRALGVKDGPLERYKQLLEALVNKIKNEKASKKIIGALSWKFNKEEVATLLHRIGRLQPLIQIALERDHLYVFFPSL